jgi:2'-hydroxyisoflavone reductase
MQYGDSDSCVDSGSGDAVDHPIVTKLQTRIPTKTGVGLGTAGEGATAQAILFQLGKYAIPNPSVSCWFFADVDYPQRSKSSELRSVWPLEKGELMDRRDFLKTSLSAIGASACASLFAPLAGASVAPKRILVLGGTLFLGPALVETLVAYGHTVTLFNRGVTNPELFPRLEKLHGFRSPDANDQDLSSLAHRRFDVIVDVWPNDPDVVRSAAQFLKDKAHHYVFVSSIGAYDSREFAKANITEDKPLEPWNSSGRPYNRNKAESERRLHEIIGQNLTIVRPGPIKGHRDDTPDLLTWLLRLREGGEHIAPGDGDDPVELVDVKDVARFLALAIDGSLYGTFNLTGKSMTFRQFLEACRSATRSDATLTWIPRDFLHEQGLETDSVLHTFAGNFPFWRPDPSSQGLYRVSSEKAFRAGWRTRPFEETAFDCLDDFHSLHLMDRSNFLSDAKETEVLERWAAHHRS